MTAGRGAPRRRRTVGVVAVVAIATLAVIAVALIGSSPDDPSPRSRPSGSERPPVEDLSRPPTEPDAASPEVPAFGMMAWSANTLSSPDFALIRSTGTGYYRFNLTLDASDEGARDPGTENFDRLIRAGVSEGIEFLPVLLRSRPSGKVGGPQQVAEPPETARERAFWREHVRFFAERYGPDGRFWREHPDLPYRPVRAWEVWNEPNLNQFWDDRAVDAGEYARLLRDTRAVLRSVDPQARIVSAGLSSRYDGAAYQTAMLEQAGGCRVDAIGIHPYAPTVEGTMAHLRDARRSADDQGAEGVPLWTTEIGWRAGGKGYTAVADARAQARRYAGFLKGADRRREELSLGPSFAFALRDRVDAASGKVTSTHGLRRTDNSPRPAWAVWTKAARGAAPLELPPARRCR